MKYRERAEETFRLIRALGRMDASMIPVIEKAIEEAVSADRSERGKTYYRCPACGQMQPVDEERRFVAHITREANRCNGEGVEALP